MEMTGIGGHLRMMWKPSAVKILGISKSDPNKDA